MSKSLLYASNVDKEVNPSLSDVLHLPILKNQSGSPDLRSEMK